MGSDFLGFISPHNAVVFHRLPAEPVGSGERGRPAPPGGRCVWGSRGQEGALRGLRGRVGSARALPGAGGASPPRVLQEPRGARAAALGVREAGRGAAAGVYRERGEAASAGAEPGREGRRREGAREKGGGSRSRRASAAGSVLCGAGGGVVMASMAAAIAASRTAVMNGNRPLDERERKRFSYFSSLSPMARKIMAEKERIRERYGPEWERLPPRQQDEIIDRCLVEPHVQARYAAHRGAARPPPPPSSYPSLRLNTGQKLVRFGDEVAEGDEPRGDPPWRGCV